MRKARPKTYAEIFNRVLDYIDQHLDEDLSVERLSRVANFSKYHFHRQFSGYTGVGVARYIQLMRLRRASYRLAFNREERLIDIALDACFENPESFSRAFKNAFGQTPSAFRKKPAWQPWQQCYQFPMHPKERTVNVQIVHFPQTKIAAFEHRGPMERVNDSARVFIAWRQESGLSPVQSSRTFGIVYDNPETTPPERFRFDIGGSVVADVPANRHGVVNKIIPAGRCAVLRHAGSHERLGESIYPLYRDWLPASGEALRDFPLFFHYLNLMPETPEHALQTDIYLPLK